MLLFSKYYLIKLRSYNKDYDRTSMLIVSKRPNSTFLSTAKELSIFETKFSQHQFVSCSYVFNNWKFLRIPSIYETYMYILYFQITQIALLSRKFILYYFPHLLNIVGLNWNSCCKLLLKVRIEFIISEKRNWNIRDRNTGQHHKRNQSRTQRKGQRE